VIVAIGTLLDTLAPPPYVGRYRGEVFCVSREGGLMTTLTIRAIYEEGKLRPLQPLPLQEHECVLLHVTREGVVQETSGLVDGLTPDIIREVAEGEEYSVLC